MKIIEDYLKEVEFEEITIGELTSQKLESLKSKEGVLIPTSTSTSLWIHRKLIVFDVLGVLTVTESISDFEICDSFGYVLCDGDVEYIVEYAKFFSENI